MIPPEFFNQAFAILDPLRTNYLKFLGLLDRLDDRAFVENFLRMEMWNADGIPMAGPTYAEFIDKGYQRNLLTKGEWILDGDDERIDLRRIDIPVATIVGLSDNLVPPESTERILEHVGSKDIKKFENPSGHIGLSTSHRAHEDLWPHFAEWLRAHDAPCKVSTASQPRAGRKPRSTRRKARRARLGSGMSPATGAPPAGAPPNLAPASPAPAPLVRVEWRGPVVILTLNNPPVNVLTIPLLDELRARVLELRKDVRVRAAVLTGSGDRAFTGGANIREMLPMSRAEATRHSAKGQELFNLLEGPPSRSSPPSVASAWAAAARWCSRATSSSRARTRSSGSPRSTSV